MILICDSGSTKSDWVLLDGKKRSYFSTSGLNPTFHDDASVEKEIRSNQQLCEWNQQVTSVYFYGAGCSTDEKKAVLERGIGRVFFKAKINVDNDLVASAYATYDGSPGIACILGTGSNACFFNGQVVTQQVPALGYILGDEGGGTFLGKRLLADYFYKRLPKSMESAIMQDLGLNKEMVIEKVYRQPHANVYLASFVPFLVRFAEENYVKELVTEGFTQFLSIHVCSYNNFQEVPVHFVGSIAHLFQQELKQVADLHQIRIGNILQKPIDGLVSYHEKKLE